MEESNLTEHKKLTDGIAELLQNKYLFQVEKNLNVPSNSIPFLKEKSEIDIFVRTKPGVAYKSDSDNEKYVYCNDFIIECKTGQNLNENDKNKILNKNEYFPVYLAYPKPQYALFSKKFIYWIKENELGLILFDEIEKSIEQVFPAKVKLYFFMGGKYSTPHKIFEYFQMKTHNNSICAPMVLSLDGVNESGWFYQFNAPSNQAEFIKHRNKFFTVFSKYKYKLSESWVIDDGIENNQSIIQGFSFPSIMFVLENMIQNDLKNRNLPNTKLAFKISEPDTQLVPKWSSSDLSYAICAECDLDTILIIFRARVEFFSGGKLDFYPTYIYSKDQLGITIQQELDVRKSNSIDLEPIASAPQIKLDKKLTLVQSLTKNRENSIRLFDTDTIYYITSNDDHFDTIMFYASSKPYILKGEEFEMQLNQRRYSNYIINGLTIQTPFWFYED